MNYNNCKLNQNLSSSIIRFDIPTNTLFEPTASESLETLTWSQFHSFCSFFAKILKCNQKVAFPQNFWHKKNKIHFWYQFPRINQLLGFENQNYIRKSVDHAYNQMLRCVFWWIPDKSEKSEEGKQIWNWIIKIKTVYKFESPLSFFCRKKKIISCIYNEVSLNC